MTISCLATLRNMLYDIDFDLVAEQLAPLVRLPVPLLPRPAVRQAVRTEVAQLSPTERHPPQLPRAVRQAVRLDTMQLLHSTVLWVRTLLHQVRLLQLPLPQALQPPRSGLKHQRVPPGPTPATHSWRRPTTALPTPPTPATHSWRRGTLASQSLHRPRMTLARAARCWRRIAGRMRHRPGEFSRHEHSRHRVCGGLHGVQLQVQPLQGLLMSLRSRSFWPPWRCWQCSSS